MRVIAIVLFVAQLAPADSKDVQDKKPDSKKHLDVLQGRWEVTAKWVRGEAAKPPELANEQTAFEFKGDRFTIQQYGRLTDEGRVAIDCSDNPKLMTLTQTAHNGEAMKDSDPDLVLYEVSGNTLRMAYSLSNKRHPRIDPDSKDQIVIFAKRAK